MLKEAVYHVARDSFAYPVSADTLRVTLRAARGDLQGVTVVYRDRYQSLEPRLAIMERVAEDELFSFFQVDLQLKTKRFSYVFLLDDGIQQLFYTEKGFFEDMCLNTEFQYPYISPSDLWEPPAWAQGAVIYQIFPERFAKGDPAIDPPTVEPWDAAPTPHSFKGGDLQGIIDRFSHLVDLGVDLLYLTPIFAAPSNHKYDTIDYYQIDPHFGDEHTLRQLIGLCHSKGIRIIFDAVFNHSGVGFFAFQDVVAKQQESAFVDWYNIGGFPVRSNPPNYETFGEGIASMPKLSTSNLEVQRYFLEVGAYWIREFGIDGWRLDVANEVDAQFWREFRKVVKGINPEALIVGEIWHEAAAWVRGDQFDSVMNYSLQHACLDFFAKGTIRARSFANRLAKIQFNHPQKVNLALFNLLGSHDTERFLSSCGEDLQKFALAVVFQLTYEGAPMIYYGDEVGMTGWGDPDCRRGMDWDSEGWNSALFTLYRRLIALRKEYPLLRHGGCRTVWADSAANVFGFVRFETSGGQILVVLNNSPRQATVRLAELPWPLGRPRQLEDLWTKEVLEPGSLQLSPYHARLLAAL